MSHPLKIVEELAQFGVNTEFERLPQTVVSSVKQRTLDILGICIAATADGLGDGVGDLVELWGGHEQAGLVNRPGKFPVPNAALYNGTLAHSLDFDDTHLPSVLHPSATVIPAMLAMAQAVGASGRDAICAAVIGYEVCVRTGMAAYDPELRNSAFFERGWHATSICGALAAAAIGAKLLRLDEAKSANAIGVAATMSSGLLESNRVGGSVKQIHCGWAAHCGLTAALLAEHGYTAPETIFEGRFGFYTAFLDGKFDASQITNQLGERWVVPEIFFKPYPSNHFTHAAIDAALALRRKYHIVPDLIEEAQLGVPTAPHRTIGEPREEKIRPISGYHARFSGPFAVATAFYSSSALGVSSEDFTDEKARDPRILSLAAKVHTFKDPECEKIFPHQFPAVLRVQLKSGQSFEERVSVNRGGPGNPLSDHELFLKFVMNAERVLPADKACRIANITQSLERLDHIGDILSATYP